jgi:hypothetical protein
MWIYLCIWIIIVTIHIKKNTKYFDGARGGVVVKALPYKPAGRGFDSRWCHWNFSVT